MRSAVKAVKMITGVSFQDADQLDKLVEKDIIEAKKGKLEKVIDHWTEVFEKCDFGTPDGKEFVCEYFKDAIDPYIKKFNEKIDKEYEEYKKKKGEDDLEDNMKKLEEKKKKLNDAYKKCCG